MSTLQAALDEYLSVRRALGFGLRLSGRSAAFLGTGTDREVAVDDDRVAGGPDAGGADAGAGRVPGAGLPVQRGVRGGKQLRKKIAEWR